MRAVSQSFLDALRTSHPIAAEVGLYFPDELELEVPVSVEAGTLTIDRTAQFRRVASVTIPWSLSSADALGLDIRLLPFGGHAELRAGIPGELVTLSSFMRVESVTWETTAQTATLELADRMAQVASEPFTLPFDTVGLRAAQAARQIVHDVFGDTITYRIEYDPPTVLLGVIFSGSRSQAVADLARAVGAEAYFDADGAFVFDVAAGGGQVATTGWLVDESTVVTGIPDTSGILVGMTVTGLGIPGGRRVVSVDSATQVTLNARANTFGVKNSRTKAGSNVLEEITDTDDLMPGMRVVGDFIPGGTVIVGVTEISKVVISNAATGDGYPLVQYHGWQAGYGPEGSPSELLFAGGSGAYPVYTVAAGEAGTFVNANESLDRSPVFNGVFMTGQETPVTPAFAVLVVDDDPTSPTFWGGPFGKVVRLERSSSIQSPEQGTYASETLLNDALGLARSLAIRAAPNPALEAGDTIAVVFDDGRNEKHVCDVVRIDLKTGPLELATRSVFRPAALDAFAATPLRRRQPLHDAAAYRELREATIV
jgi:hypothetical protein